MADRGVAEFDSRIVPDGVAERSHCPIDGDLLFVAKGEDLRLDMVASDSQQFRDSEGFMSAEELTIRYCNQCGFVTGNIAVSFYMGYVLAGAIVAGALLECMPIFS
jgi:hypothetical protein